MSIYQSQKSFAPATSDLTLSSADRARDLNKYYTKAEVARQCIDDFQRWTEIDLPTTNLEILEPSAGAGAFLDFLPHCTLAYDLQPEDPRIAKQDFLKLNRRQPAVVIGNPPFGRNCCRAIQFFNHASTFADHIGFIVPRTFEKVSIQNRLNFQFHLVEQRVLAEDSFTFEGKTYSVPTIFQVWSKRDKLRPRISLSRIHPDFKFVSRNEGDFAIQRVGANAGKLKTCIGDIAESSHYFLRANGSSAELLSVFQELDFSDARSRTAGNPSIAKTEIVSLYSVAKFRSTRNRNSI